MSKLTESGSLPNITKSFMAVGSEPVAQQLRIAMMRLFIGISLPDQIRTDLAELHYGLPGAKWIEPSNLHLTLRFIGDTDTPAADDLHSALAMVSSSPFEMRVTGLGCFETGRKVRTLWAGIEKQSSLTRLQEKIESAVVRAAFPPERRKFKPHITLARFKYGTSARIGYFIGSHNCFSAGPFPVDRYTLFRSHLGRDGAHYEELFQYPLRS